MSRRTTIILILIAATCFPAFSQVSGYMGKRTLAGYSLTLAPNVIALLAGDAYEPRLSTAHTLGLSYVTGRYGTVGLDFTAIRTDSYSEVHDYYGNIIKSDITIAGNSLGVTFTKFGGKKGKLPAPLGKFFQTRVFYSFFKTVNSLGEPEVVFNPDFSTSWIFPGPQTDNFSGVGLALGIGNNIVIKNRVIFHYGGELSYHYFMLEEQTAGSSGEAAFSKAVVTYALLDSYTITLKAGLSGLLF